MKKETIVAVSGGFDPIQYGHINLFNAAKKLGDKLVVILNNDNWLQAKKGYAFMPELERVIILQNLKAVDMVLVTDHSPEDKDRSVCKTLESLEPDIFANGGDRFEDNVPEKELCEKLNIKMKFNVGGTKVQSSSILVRNAMKQEKDKEKKVYIL